MRERLTKKLDRLSRVLAIESVYEASAETRLATKKCSALATWNRYNRGDASNALRLMKQPALTLQTTRLTLRPLDAAQARRA